MNCTVKVPLWVKGPWALYLCLSTVCSEDLLASSLTPTENPRCLQYVQRNTVELESGWTDGEMCRNLCRPERFAPNILIWVFDCHVTSSDMSASLRPPIWSFFFNNFFLSDFSRNDKNTETFSMGNFGDPSTPSPPPQLHHPHQKWPFFVSVLLLFSKVVERHTMPTKLQTCFPQCVCPR